MSRFFLIPFLIFSLGAYSSEWVSPIDKKYLAKNPEAFSRFSKAREILNSWRGQKRLLAEADGLLREVLAEDENFAPAYREYGRFFIMGGHINYDNFRNDSLSSAESAILKSISIEPQYADSYVLLGHLYTNMKRYDEAIKSLEEAEKIGTKIPWLHLNWADVYKKQRNYKKAKERYQIIVDQGTPNKKAYANALYGMAMVHNYMGHYDKANDWFKKLLEYEPESAWHWGNYSSFLLYTYNDVDGAIENGEKALSIMNYGMGRFTLACALYTKWAKLLQDPIRHEEANRYFEQAWSLYPYPKKVIEKTRRYKYTRITATEMQKMAPSKM